MANAVSPAPHHTLTFDRVPTRMIPNCKTRGSREAANVFFGAIELVLELAEANGEGEPIEQHQKGVLNLWNESAMLTLFTDAPNSACSQTTMHLQLEVVQR